MLPIIRDEEIYYAIELLEENDPILFEEPLDELNWEEYLPKDVSFWQGKNDNYKYVLKVADKELVGRRYRIVKYTEREEIVFERIYDGRKSD